MMHEAYSGELDRYFTLCVCARQCMKAGRRPTGFHVMKLWSSISLPKAVSAPETYFRRTPDIKADSKYDT